jgi:hypothetical protein
MAIADQRQDRLGVRIGGGEASVFQHGLPSTLHAFQREQDWLAWLAIEQAQRIGGARNPDRARGVGRDDRRGGRLAARDPNTRHVIVRRRRIACCQQGQRQQRRASHDLSARE